MIKVIVEKLGDWSPLSYIKLYKNKNYGKRKF